MGLSVDVAPKLSVELAGYRDTVRYDQGAFFLGTSLRSTLNRTDEGPRLTVRARLDSLTTIYVAAELDKVRFAFSPVRDTDGYRIAPGVTFGRKALITGDAEVGVRHFKGLDPSLPDFSGLVARTDLSTTIAGATELGVAWSRDVAYSYNPTTPYYIATSIAGQVRREIAGGVDAILSATRYVNSYRALLTPGAPVANPGRGVTLTYSADLGYRLNRQARIGLVVSEWQRRSNAFASQDYKGLRAGVSFTYGFQ